MAILKRARRLPRRENLETNFVNILVLVYVEYCQRGQPLLTHSASKRGFQSLHAVKTAFAAQVDTELGACVMKCPVDENCFFFL